MTEPIRTDRAGRPVLDQFSEEGFVDLTFRIDDRADDGRHWRFRLAASHRNRIVGFEVELVKGIKSGFDAKMTRVKHVYREGVRFRRSGPESDRFVAILAELYRSRRKPKRMIEEESFTAIALHQGKLDWDRDAIKLKLFGRDAEPIDESAYYESFFNVDFANGFVFWNEKDNDYRRPLLKALCSP